MILKTCMLTENATYRKHSDKAAGHSCPLDGVQSAVSCPVGSAE